MFCRSSDKFWLVPVPPANRETMANSKPAKPVRCDFCLNSDETYDSDTELELHKQRKHNKYIPKLLQKHKHMCRMCLRKADSRAALQKHFKTAHLLCYNDESRIHREVFICDYCERLFFSKHMLACHIVRSHKLHLKEFTCPKCEKGLKSKSSYMHFQAHSMNSVNVCPICFLKFNRKKEVNEHVQGYHPCTFQCSLCYYDTKKHSNLMFHVAKAHGLRTPIAAADIATARQYFATGVPPKKNKQSYVAPLVTKGVLLYGATNICVLCQEICADDRDMLSHYLEVHVASKPAEKKKKYICTCGEDFFNNILLEHHIFRQGLHPDGSKQLHEKVEELTLDVE